MQPSFSSSPSYERIKRLNAIGIALSAQKDQGKLLCSGLIQMDTSMRDNRDRKSTRLNSSH